MSPYRITRPQWVDRVVSVVLASVDCKWEAIQLRKNRTPHITARPPLWKGLLRLLALVLTFNPCWLNLLQETWYIYFFFIRYLCFDLSIGATNLHHVTRLTPTTHGQIKDIAWPIIIIIHKQWESYTLLILLGLQSFFFHNDCQKYCNWYTEQKTHIKINEEFNNCENCLKKLFGMG